MYYTVSFLEKLYFNNWGTWIFFCTLITESKLRKRSCRIRWRLISFLIGLRFHGWWYAKSFVKRREVSMALANLLLTRSFHMKLVQSSAPQPQSMATKRCHCSRISTESSRVETQPPGRSRLHFILLLGLRLHSKLLYEAPLQSAGLHSWNWHNISLFCDCSR